MANRSEAGLMDSTFASVDRKWLRSSVLGRTESAELVMISLPAPVRDPALVFSVLGAGPAFFWRGPGEGAVVGSGIAHRFSASGDDRFKRIRDDAAPILEAIKRVDFDSNLQIEPRAFGGFAFQPRGTDHAPWTDFDDACFVLPRLRYSQTSDAACLSLCLTSQDLRQADHVEHWLDQLLHFRSRIERVLPPSARLGANGRNGTSAGLSEAAFPASDLQTWNTQIEKVLEAIHSGKCEKVVVARCSELSLPTSIDVGEALALLANQTPEEASCFGFRFGESSFIGATPERLITKTGLSLRSEALAGTVRTGDEERARALLRDPKELREHWLVVGAILDALKPLCSRVESPPVPELRRLRHLLHLRTPITAELAAPVHVLDLAARLHPTPAVGGVPGDWATAWIAENESKPRGWYAGPVGWFNAAGDGALDVALRSGLIKGQTAFLYAGAGIVEGSNAESEYAETQLKLASVLSAIRAR